jgi:hypothetical protein
MNYDTTKRQNIKEIKVVLLNYGHRTAVNRCIFSPQIFLILSWLDLQTWSPLVVDTVTSRFPRAPREYSFIVMLLLM